MNDAQLTRSQIISEILQRWNKAGLSYAVLHGFQDGQAGRDLDFLADSDSEPRALQMAEEYLLQSGFDVAWPPSIFGPRLIAFRKNAWESGIEIHSVPGVRWRNVTFAAKPTNVISVQDVQTDVWASFAKRVICPLLAQGGAVKEKIAREPGLDHDQAQAITRSLSAFVGEKLARETLGSWRTADPAALDQLSARLRSAATLRGWRAPLRSIQNVLRQSFRHFARRSQPCAPLLVVVGPDGVGKSTILATLRSGSPALFQKIVIRHWRPALLPPLADLFRGRWRNKGNSSPVAPRRKAGRFQWLRAMYYWLDFKLGGWWIDRSDLSVQRLVIYDRYTLDMVVDPLRYGLSTSAPGRWLWRASLQPDAVVLLQAKPEVIHQRKAEISEDEIRTQFEAWNKLRASGVEITVLDAAQPVEKIVEQLRELIIRKFLEKNRRPSPTHAATS